MPISNSYRTTSHGPRTASLALRSLPGSDAAVGPRCTTAVSTRSAGHTGTDEIHTIALQLFLCAVMNTAEAAQPGFVSDEFLDGVKDDIDLAVVELCNASLWHRTAGGYQIPVQRLHRAVALVHEIAAHRTEPPTIH